MDKKEKGCFLIWVSRLALFYPPTFPPLCLLCIVLVYSARSEKYSFKKKKKNSLFHFTHNKKKWKVMKRENTHLDVGKKLKKKIVHFGAYYVYAHFLQWTFYFPVLSLARKKLRENMRLFWGKKLKKKNSTILTKNRFFTFPFYPWQ
jgi:hypothetical protein